MLGFYLALFDSDKKKSQFETLYTTHKDLMYSVAFNILKDAQSAEDAVHDAFVVLAENMDKLSERSAKESRNYLIVIVKNAALKIYNKHKKIVYCDDLFVAEPDALDIEEDIVKKLTHEELLEIIRSLDEKYTDVFLMKYYYGMKDKEISKAVGITVEAVKARLHRGKSILKNKILEKELFD